MMRIRSPTPLYKICIEIAVADCVTVCKFCKKEFRSLPNNVLFDFYYKMYLQKRLCLLAVEFSDLEVFSRMLSVKNKRVKLLQSLQSLIDHGTNVPDELIQSYSKYLQDATTNLNNHNIIETGIRIGSFFNEGGWYNYSIIILSMAEELCKKQGNNSPEILKKCLDCYHKRIFAEAIYCEFEAAAKTFQSAQNVIKQLTDLNELPNLAGLYANFATLFFHRYEYDEAFAWSNKALELLNDDLPSRVIIDVLRQASKACVMKRRFNQAGLLIRQAVNLASEIYEKDGHPHYSDTLLDYGFYLLNFDSIQESVKVYDKSLKIRREVFEKNNIYVALAHEDMAYAQYVNEYSSGRFYTARENAERSIRIMERILPSDHLKLASAKRVKALILEEIALDMRGGTNSQKQDEYFTEAEELHKTALSSSRQAFGEKNVQTAKHYGNLGRLYQSMRLYSEAEKMHLRAIAIKEELLGPDDYEVGLSLGHLASLYNYHMKRHQDAEKLYKRSMEINLNLFGETYSGFEYDYRGLINVYSKLADQSNLDLYNRKMNHWKLLRDSIKPIEHKQELQPLKDVIKKFFSMC